MDSSIVGAITDAKKSKAGFEDFCIQTKGGLGERIAKNYIKKLDYILLDFVPNPAFSDEIRESIRKEIASDAFQSDAILEKILLLDCDKRHLVETLVDGLLNGEEIHFIEK